jgi:predicted DNA binding CopG/RHH family protein
MEDPMRGRIELDQFENDIEAHSSEYVPISAAKRAKIEAILERARKTRNINIRISEYDLDRLKQRAEEEGIPYQTLISSILHKFVSDRLVDEKDILKSLQLMGTRD